MNLWLDDLRKPLDKSREWDWLKTVDDAIDYSNGLIRFNKQISVMSLDHDLGDFAAFGGDGIKYLDWMIQNHFWPLLLNFHTQNPVGRQNMINTVQGRIPTNCMITINCHIIQFQI